MWLKLSSCQRYLKSSFEEKRCGMTIKLNQKNLHYHHIVWKYEKKKKTFVADRHRTQIQLFVELSTCSSLSFKASRAHWIVLYALKNERARTSWWLVQIWSGFLQQMDWSMSYNQTRRQKTEKNPERVYTLCAAVNKAESSITHEPSPDSDLTAFGSAALFWSSYWS